MGGAMKEKSSETRTHYEFKFSKDLLARVIKYVSTQYPKKFPNGPDLTRFVKALRILEGRGGTIAFSDPKKAKAFLERFAQAGLISRATYKKGKDLINEGESLGLFMKSIVSEIDANLRKTAIPKRKPVTTVFGYHQQQLQEGQKRYSKGLKEFNDHVRDVKIRNAIKTLRNILHATDKDHPYYFFFVSSHLSSLNNVLSGLDIGLSRGNKVYYVSLALIDLMGLSEAYKDKSREEIIKKGREISSKLRSFVKALDTFIKIRDNFRFDAESAKSLAIELNNLWKNYHELFPGSPDEFIRKCVLPISKSFKISYLKSKGVFKIQLTAVKSSRYERMLLATWGSVDSTEMEVRQPDGTINKVPVNFFDRARFAYGNLYGEYLGYVYEIGLNKDQANLLLSHLEGYSPYVRVHLLKFLNVLAGSNVSPNDVVSLVGQVGSSLNSFYSAGDIVGLNNALNSAIQRVKDYVPDATTYHFSITQGTGLIGKTTFPMITMFENTSEYKNISFFAPWPVHANLEVGDTNVMVPKPLQIGTGDVSPLALLNQTFSGRSTLWPQVPGNMSAPQMSLYSMYRFSPGSPITGPWQSFGGSLSSSFNVTPSNTFWNSSVSVFGSGGGHNFALSGTANDNDGLVSLHGNAQNVNDLVGRIVQGQVNWVNEQEANAFLDQMIGNNLARAIAVIDKRPEDKVANVYIYTYRGDKWVLAKRSRISPSVYQARFGMGSKRLGASFTYFYIPTGENYNLGIKGSDKVGTGVEGHISFKEWSALVADNVLRDLSNKEVHNSSMVLAYTSEDKNVHMVGIVTKNPLVLPVEPTSMNPTQVVSTILRNTVFRAPFADGLAYMKGYQLYFRGFYKTKDSSGHVKSMHQFGLIYNSSNGTALLYNPALGESQSEETAVSGDSKLNELQGYYYYDGRSNGWKGVAGVKYDLENGRLVFYGLGRKIPTKYKKGATGSVVRGLADDTTVQVKYEGTPEKKEGDNYLVDLKSSRTKRFGKYEPVFELYLSKKTSDSSISSRRYAGAGLKIDSKNPWQILARVGEYELRPVGGSAQSGVITGTSVRVDRYSKSGRTTYVLDITGEHDQFYGKGILMRSPYVGTSSKPWALSVAGGYGNRFTGLSVMGAYGSWFGGLFGYDASDPLLVSNLDVASPEAGAKSYGGVFGYTKATRRGVTSGAMGYMSVNGVPSGFISLYGRGASSSWLTDYKVNVQFSDVDWRVYMLGNMAYISDYGWLWKFGVNVNLQGQGTDSFGGSVFFTFTGTRQ